MIDAPRLLKALQVLLRSLEDDLRERVRDVPELDAKLRGEYRTSFDKGRTGQAYEEWREDSLTQAAVAWILGCVFVRFLEDNGLVETPKLSGPGDRRQRALDQHELYFKDPARRTHSDRDYLLHVFAEVQKLPAAREVFDPDHNPLWSLGLSGDGAGRLLGFWHHVDPETGSLSFDFTDPEWNTRFLGDLYQDLSESARKKYALLQTPEFVEEFILDRTLTPAIEEFGFREVRMIDPTCGSGHFLLGGFHRLFDLWIRNEPETNSRELAQRALGQVYGVDLNPFAVAIAKFRLLVAALKASEVTRLADAPQFHLNLAAGDSLLHGTIFGSIRGTQRVMEPLEDPLRHVYEREDAEALGRILGQQYHAVVGNPPFITMRDKSLSLAYRQLYRSCHRKYSLCAPFVERFFNLALSRVAESNTGLVGIIVANSFMKREFGTKLVEEVLPFFDLTHLIDTSGAYVPGHGTPTVILLGRNQAPVGATVRAVRGIRGEPTTPNVPALGLVWSAIVAQVDRIGSQSEWVGVSNLDRGSLASHPWSIGGGGAAELKSELDDKVEHLLSEFVVSIGPGATLGEDDAFRRRPSPARRCRLAPVAHWRPLVEGDAVRDWSLEAESEVLFPYDSDIRLIMSPSIEATLWPFRTTLWDRADFSKQTYREVGRPFWEYQQIPPDRNKTPLSIAFAFVATHNHFVLDRGGKVFKQSAPIIKLPAGATEEEHLGLLGLLNSSTACFWMKQVSHSKGVGGIGGGIGDEAWEPRYEFTGTGLGRFPVPRSRPLDLARRLDSLAGRLNAIGPASWGATTPASVLRLDDIRNEVSAVQQQMISLQEELDWECYFLYGLIESPLTCAGDPPPIRLGERAFEIGLARELESGEVETTWFERHRSTPVAVVPEHLPVDYRELVEKRIELIETDRNIGLVEQPEYKRRWNSEPWESQLAAALREWMAAQLESQPDWTSLALRSIDSLSSQLSQDPEFLRVAAVYRGRTDFDIASLLEELALADAVPFVSTLRFKQTGLRKYDIWKSTWDLQRKEDAGELSPAEAKQIPVPPKYTGADYQTTAIWQLRGKLDVPKERFLSFPLCERDSDPTLVIGWAGWNHLEQSQAIATYYLQMKEKEGWTAERLTPLLTGIQERVPWVKQWHNESDAEHRVRMGDYFADFVESEARELGLTLADIENWTPPKGAMSKRTGKKR